MSAQALEPAVARALERKRARRGVVVHEAPVASVIEERLQRFLAKRIDGAFSVSGLGRMAGGASKEQFSFELEWEGRRERMVLRMDPPASLVETARLREVEVLRALGTTVPAPVVHFATEDPEELGAAAMVCGFVEGVVAPAGAPKTASGLGTTYGPRLRGELGPQFVDHLAAIHRFDWTAHELPSFERPRAGSTDALDWRLSHFDAMWRDDRFEAHPSIALVREWLWANRPEVDHVSIVHGDYRNGNFLFDEASEQITAVLDWELTCLGDRHHDLAYVVMKDWGQQDPDTGASYCCALMEREELFARYEAASGLTVDPARIDYYVVLNLYWAAVCTIACGVRAAAERMTHLDVLQNIVSGLGVAFLHEAATLIEEA